MTCLTSTQSVAPFTAFVALFCSMLAVEAARGAVTLTGAQLASDSRVTFPTYTPTVSGSSIILGPGDLNFAKFMDVNLGTFTYSDVLEVKLNMTVLTADSDPKFLLSDGIRMYGASLGDDNGGTMNFIRFSDNGNRGGYDGSDFGFQNAGYPPIGGTFDLTLRFSFSPTSSTAYGAYLAGSAQFSTPSQYIDPTLGLHFVVVQDNEDTERYQINSITLPVPEPVSVAVWAGAGTIVFGRRRRLEARG